MKILNKIEHKQIQLFFILLLGLALFNACRVSLIPNYDDANSSTN